MHVLPYRPQLSEKLEKAGPVPFAPAEIEKRLAPEEILADTKSIAVLLFPYRYPEEKNANIALMHEPKIITTLSARILQKLSDIWKSSIPMKIPCYYRHIPHGRPLARLPGRTRFFGRNHCLIHPKYGSYFTIGAILTTLALPPDTRLQ
ncbi:MAG: hypothetical protein ACLRZN_04310 [Dialister invisus]